MRLRLEQNKIAHIYFANGVEEAADETSLISSEVECMVPLTSFTRQLN